MPPPAERGRPYVAGLDGVRAVAVLTVIAYHLGLPAARGGMLGVGVFFTLSGYLITDLLLGHWERCGDLGLGRFWLRRACSTTPATTRRACTRAPIPVRLDFFSAALWRWSGRAVRHARLRCRLFATCSTHSASRVSSASCCSWG